MRVGLRAGGVGGCEAWRGWGVNCAPFRWSGLVSAGFGEGWGEKEDRCIRMYSYKRWCFYGYGHEDE